MWPYADLKIDLMSGDGGVEERGDQLRRVEQPPHRHVRAPATRPAWLHYEEDFYAAFTLGFAGATSFTTQFTAYTSPERSCSPRSRRSCSRSRRPAGSRRTDSSPSSSAASRHRPGRRRHQRRDLSRARRRPELDARGRRHVRRSAQARPERERLLRAQMARTTSSGTSTSGVLFTFPFSSVPSSSAPGISTPARTPSRSATRPRPSTSTRTARRATARSRRCSASASDVLTCERLNERAGLQPV